VPVSVQTVSRRDFVRWSLAFGAAVAMPRKWIAAAPSPTSDHLALLSDVHVSGGIDGSMGRRLSVAVKQVLALPKPPQQVLVAGDCAFLKGKARDYQEYVRRMQPLIDAGLPLHMTIGNHDDRERFWEAVPREQTDASLNLRRQSMVVSAQHANWFLLDSLNKTNSSPGELGRDQLEWLSAELDARAEKPALLMLHHDPVRNGKTGSLRDSEQLLAITRARRHVKALFFGHTHVWNVAQDRSGIHLVNLPATGYTLFMRSFIGWVSCQVHGDGAVLKVHTLDPEARENGRIVRLAWRAT
jgi:3',5'-cyclic-AMP phosphodiesterase